ncbi:MAG: nitrophenyl compound nitroreductase subunit ArsF family protein [Planctomycetota bacterium]|jgi:hypothetical protein
MTARKAIAIALGLFAAVSVAYVIYDESTDRDPTKPVDAVEGDQLIAYYFHRNRRCTTCNAIESYSKQAIEKAFPDQLRSGRLVWRTINYEQEPQFRERYSLYTSTLLLADYRDGTELDWHELDETWHLVKDKAAFQAYVERETRAILESAR